MNTDNSGPLAMDVLNLFRQELYQRALIRRRDTLFELMEAVLCTPGPSTLVRLSLSPLFHRRWPSVPDALAEGAVDEAQIRLLLCSHIPQPPSGEPPIWACDGSVWPRPKAETSPERTYGHWTSQGLPQEGVIPAWEYQWLGVVPTTTGSWFLPLDVARRVPNTVMKPTQLAIAQLQSVLAALRSRAYPRPIVTFDSNYDLGELAEAIQTGPYTKRLEIDALVRLHPKRTFFRRPDPASYSGRGRRPIHGLPFRLPDPSTYGTPDREMCTTDPTHGEVHICAWQDLHPFGKADLSVTVIRIEVEHLPKSGHKPKPLWLGWISLFPLTDLLAAWGWYRRRFVCEHGFRFFKQDLGWTTVRPRWPKAADRWTWLIVVATWHLWLARALVIDQRLPWERVLPSNRLTPGRVRRVVGTILAGLRHPQAPVRQRGKSPGRAIGCRPGRRQRYKVVKRPRKPSQLAA
jgi:hypothetical protein